MKLLFSALARQDLDNVFTYIDVTLHNSIAARNTISGIISVSARLSEFPKLGTILTLPNSSIIEIRYIISGSYIIVYVVEPSAVEIIRILYARSDYLKLLQA